jgi:hypothetical protein
MAHANAPADPDGKADPGRADRRPTPSANRPHRPRDEHLPDHCLPLVGRYQQLGQAGLVDRPSIPLRSPRRTAARLEECILGLRRRERLGPARIAARVGVPASTVYRVLVRHGCNRLAWLDRPTGRPIRRYEHLGPATWSTWTSRSWAVSPPVVATECTVGLPGRSTAAPTGRAAATTTCMPRLTTTPAWPM